MFYRVCSSDTKHYSSLSLLVNLCSLYPPSCCVLVQTETRCLTSPQCMLGNSQWGLGTHKHTVPNTHSKRHTCFNISMVILIILTQSVCMLITSSFSLMGGEGGFIYNSCCWGERERERVVGCQKVKWEGELKLEERKRERGYKKDRRRRERALEATER